MVLVVEDAPLTLCDRRSVDPRDFPEVDKVHDEYLGENNYLKFADSQRWYYLSKQRQDEPVMFLTWDSDAKFPYPGVSKNAIYQIMF